MVDSGGRLLQMFDMNAIQPHPTQFLTPEMLMSLKKISEPKISPDGKWVLYTLAVPDIVENKSNKDIYIISIDGKTTVKLTDDPSNDYNGCWSPDSKEIAFVSDRSGKPQIYIMDTEGKNVRLISNVVNGVENLTWSPDGEFFAFTTEVKLEETPQEIYLNLPKTNVRIYDKLPVRHWDTWRGQSYSHLYIVKTTGGGVDLMSNEPYDTPLKPFGGVEEIAWSPDSKEIAYTCKKVKDFVQSTNSDIFIVPKAGGSVQNITEGLMSFDKDPLYSPDGNWIAFHSQERPGFESDRVRLFLYNRKTRDRIELSKTLDQWVGNMVWAPDSKSIYFNAEDGPTVQIYQISVPDGKWKILTKGWFNCDGSIDITPDGSTLVFERRSMLQPYEIYSMSTSVDVAPTKLTKENDEALNLIKTPTIKERWITSTDGKKVHCWVIYPLDFDSTRKYPMITYCQGGPQSTISQYFSLRWNFFLMASQGYIVLAPNRRGMPGFGQAWNDAISKDWAGMPMNDILAATDEMAKEPYVIKSGIAAVGASAGGYAAFWLAGNHNKRFAAFVAHCGVFDMVSKYGSTEELWFPNWEFGGPYWDPKVKSFYEKNSPHNFVQNWDTPIMISTGEKDFRVPFTQSLEAFTAAQVKGIPSKILIFPNENHWILNLQNQILWYKEFFGFLDKYCKK